MCQIAAREVVFRLRHLHHGDISRGRTWVHLSGTGTDGSPLADGIRRVLASGPELCFTDRQPKRHLLDVRT